MIGKAKDWVIRYIDYKKLPSLVGQESGKGGYKEGLILLIVSQLVNALAFFVSFPLSMVFTPLQFEPVQLLLSLSVLSFIGMVAFYVIGLTIFLAGTLLGGKGTPDNLLYLLSVMNLCSRIVTAPFVILSAVEPISFLMLLAVSLIGLYGLYAVYLAVRGSLSLSPLRAIASMLAGLLVVILVLAVLGLSAGQV